MVLEDALCPFDLPLSRDRNQSCYYSEYVEVKDKCQKEKCNELEFSKEELEQNLFAFLFKRLTSNKISFYLSLWCLSISSSPIKRGGERRNQDEGRRGRDFRFGEGGGGGIDADSAKSREGSD